MDFKLQGVLPPIVTPFKNEEVDLEALRDNINRWNSTGLSGYLVVGSNGEAVYLNEAEWEKTLVTAKEAAGEDKFIMAGCGRESTINTVAACKRAAELGADCALVITPSYFKGQMTPPRLAAHFERVAGESPIPILAYNFPQATGLNMGPELVAGLSQHANVAGIKDSSGNIAQLSEIVRLASDEFSVFVGNAEVFYPALCVGAVGAILAVANVLPEMCVELQAAYDAGGHAKAKKLQWDLAWPAALVTRVHGVGGLKTAMALAGYSAGTVRMPLSMPAPQAVDEINAAFKDLVYQGAEELS